MNTIEFEKLFAFETDGHKLSPSRDAAFKLIAETPAGEELFFKRIQARDMDKHKAFFALLNYIWKLTPESFQSNVPQDLFFKYIQAGRGDFKKGFTFGHGFVFPVFKSVSFGNMTDQKFADYIKEVLPFIYANIIAHYFEVDKAERIVKQIEKEFKHLLKKLNYGEI